jgi:hypothetical protein
VILACDPRVLVCPTCQKPLRGLTAGDGSFVARCNNRVLVTVDGQLRAVPCRPAVHVTGVSRQGVAFVIPISGDHYDRYATDATAHDVYLQAGALAIHPTLRHPDDAETPR